MQHIFIGIDVAKGWLDIHHPHRKPARIENVPKAAKAFAGACKKEDAWVIQTRGGSQGPDRPIWAVGSTDRRNTYLESEVVERSP